MNDRGNWLHMMFTTQADGMLMVIANGRETEGELHRFEYLVRNGADFFVEILKERNSFAAPNVKPFYRFRPIP
ncbi:hypothetical protein JGH11_16400 [Dysgonomonas sp. Marseille-P4677]|uniref:hypothetical protein n=1 Tax=Dysgonomonas sp. Marseille-P4677 TaxID=2364790 RepID=UPI001913A2EF|nr:hypothetical protein [Dysgonomonas sp. Marseille-P4677]MBK5722456.1 hypothetical protein [Dysgonomonas sp. Marseille-P4677]